ncbi:hypothetical protein HHA04nite_18710 [Halomonas halophila]|uniref:Uncharacterized protein n=1 Tax=Halomonas halophila TaxID=29573 RepID=A0ABQ0U468_9GAMM|nr:hypothetical protein HHA04nite_18710 [Halomonas halophila]
MQLAQLGVIQPAGDFLAIAGDEGHGGAAVEQFHGGRNLRAANAEFLGETIDDLGLCVHVILANPGQTIATRYHTPGGAGRRRRLWAA